MTSAELIEKLAEFPPEMPVYIGDITLEPLTRCEIFKEEIEETEWFEDKFVGYKKVKVIIVGR